MKTAPSFVSALAILFMFSGCALRSGEENAPEGSVTWRVNTVERVGGMPTTVVGIPRIIDTPQGRAVQFDGEKDGLLINTNPLMGAKSFTVEAVFRPDSGGNTEQRFLHLQEIVGDNRILLETRLAGDSWYLDTYIKSGDQDLTLASEQNTHPLGQWYHVALVFDGTVMRHYVDGNEESFDPLKIQPFGEGRVSLGMRINRVSFFRGAIRMVRFTPRVLGPEEFMGK